MYAIFVSPNDSFVYWEPRILVPAIDLGTTVYKQLEDNSLACPSSAVQGSITIVCLQVYIVA